MATVNQAAHRHRGVSSPQTLPTQHCLCSLHETLLPGPRAPLRLSAPLSFVLSHGL